MTLDEALEKRIPRIRCAVWANPNAYLRLPLMENGTHGPWAELYDDRVQKDVLNVTPGSQKILIIGSPFGGTEWEPYTGPVSAYEQENFARVYLEA